MKYVYIDSGTTNTRIYLIYNQKLHAKQEVKVGTKDSAISGSNEILLRALKKGYDELLEANSLSDAHIEQIWLSGMITNTFGIYEVPHMTLPIDAKDMAEQSYRYIEKQYFKRELVLVRGAKTTNEIQDINLENLAEVNNVRGEEIEMIGVMASEVSDTLDAFVAIFPGSHTHACFAEGGRFCDIISTFTGELYNAIRTETILSGELCHKDIPATPKMVEIGYNYLEKYGMARALYLVHASKVFSICSDEDRTCLLSAVIAGGVIDLVKQKLMGDWDNAKKILIVGNKKYMNAYKLIADKVIPNIPVNLVSGLDEEGFAVKGFLELLKYNK